MRNLLRSTLGLALSASLFVSCDNAQEIVPQDHISDQTLAKIATAGFSTDGVIKSADGDYIVEGDIYLTDATLDQIIPSNEVPGVEQYHTTNLVNAGGGRNITMYAPEGGRNGYSPAMIAGLDEAIARYNAENLSITFSRVSSSGAADIVMTRLSKRDERRGVLGSAGFPTGGNPYGEIKMSGVLESSYGLSTNGIATIIAHEMGHCIGFRHTDYFDRSISCGGSTSNEGQAGVGAIHVPGTPTGASLANKSFMLSCADGGDRPFNNNDVTALNYLY